VPTVPKGFTVTGATNTSVSFSWSAPDCPGGGAGGVTGYVVQVDDGTGTNSNFVTGYSGSALSATITGLSNNGTNVLHFPYVFRVHAVSAVGSSPFAELRVRPNPNGALPPAAPAPVTVRPGSLNDTQFTAQWTQPALNGIDLLRYTLYLAAYPAFTGTFTPAHIIYNGPAPAFDVSGLTGATTYAVAVSATSLVGTGPLSAAVNITTATPTVCPNACSGHGTCVAGTSKLQAQSSPLSCRAVVQSWC
jgi:hypothetical protein